MNKKASANSFGAKVYCKFEQTDNNHRSKITSFHNKYSAGNTKAIGCFRIHFLLVDNTWSTRYNMPQNDRYSNSSSQWTLLSLYLIVENYGMKLIYDEIESALAVMAFSNIAITHSVY